jgi:hypothetical protein
MQRIHDPSADRGKTGAALAPTRRFICADFG